MRWMEPDQKALDAWQKWLAESPENVRKVAERFEPWKLYRIGSGHRVTIYSFDEMENGDVTLKVNVSGEFNLLTFERTVFGIDPDEMEECDLPTEDEPVGVALTDPDDVDDYLESRRDQLKAEGKL